MACTLGQEPLAKQRNKRKKISSGSWEHLKLHLMHGCENCKHLTGRRETAGEAGFLLCSAWPGLSQCFLPHFEHCRLISGSPAESTEG